MARRYLQEIKEMEPLGQEMEKLAKQGVIDEVRDGIRTHNVAARLITDSSKFIKEAQEGVDRIDHWGLGFLAYSAVVLVGLYKLVRSTVLDNDGEPINASEMLQLGLYLGIILIIYMVGLLISTIDKSDKLMGNLDKFETRSSTMDEELKKLYQQIKQFESNRSLKTAGDIFKITDKEKEILKIAEELNQRLIEASRPQQ